MDTQIYDNAFKKTVLNVYIHAYLVSVISVFDSYLFLCNYVRTCICITTYVATYSTKD